MTDFTALVRLRLTKVFAANKLFADVKRVDDFFSALFEYSDRGLFFFIDDSSKGHVAIVNETKNIGVDKMLSVYNPEHGAQFLWHIDGVMYKKGAKCDGALINQDNLYLLEFKSQAKNNTNETVFSEYEHAKQQLEHVLQDLLLRYKAIGMDLHALIDLHAIAIFNKTVPQNLAYQKRLQAEFLTKHNVRLEFSNKINVNK